MQWPVSRETPRCRRQPHKRAREYQAKVADAVRLVSRRDLGRCSGGSVVDGAARCPFHGLRFDGEGKCVGTEYPGDLEVKLSLRSWPVVEQLGCIFVHAGHDGAAPTWELPEYDMDGWTEPVTKVLTLKGHVQDVAENAVDFGHFATVHNYSELEDPVVRIEGPRMYSKFGFARRNPLFPTTNIQSIFDTDVHGLGLSVTDLRVPMDVPALIQGDGPIAKFRRWTKQFYA